MITVRQLEKNLTGDPERIERMMRVLPDMLREERIKPMMHRNIKVEKNLEKRLKMVQNLWVKECA